MSMLNTLNSAWHVWRVRFAEKTLSSWCEETQEGREFIASSESTGVFESVGFEFVAFVQSLMHFHLKLSPL